jgi:hypothetical protein
MVVTNTQDIINLCKEIMMSKKQILFYDTYIKNNLHMGNTARELGITFQAGSTYLKVQPIKFCLRIYQMKEDKVMEEQFTPSIEWITNQWTKLYQSALVKGDEKEARAILGKLWI